MRLILIRHGDPDYVHDTLTEKGWREAALLAERAKHWKVDEAFVSPLGRARDTAAGCLKAWGMRESILGWTQEFYFEWAEKEGKLPLVWDFLPAEWTVHEENFREVEWLGLPELAHARAPYEATCAALDAFLAGYGYTRTGRFYRCNAPCEKTIVLFCHFGIAMVMLSHLLNISAQTLLHGFFLPPTSVTVLNTEERRAGDAYFRAERVGDCAHLILGGEPISGSGYFTELFQENKENWR